MVLLCRQKQFLVVIVMFRQYQRFLPMAFVMTSVNYQIQLIYVMSRLVQKGVWFRLVNCGLRHLLHYQPIINGLIIHIGLIVRQEQPQLLLLLKIIVLFSVSSQLKSLLQLLTCINYYDW